MITAKRTIKAKKIPDAVRLDNFHFAKDIKKHPQSVLEYMVKDSIEAFKNKRKMLTSSLVKELNQVFGKCACAMRGEYYTRAWELDYKRHTFIVWTAEGRGTTYELVVENFPNTYNEILYNLSIDFLKQFRKQVLEVT